MRKVTLTIDGCEFVYNPENERYEFGHDGMVSITLDPDEGSLHYHLYIDSEVVQSRPAVELLDIRKALGAASLLVVTKMAELKEKLEFLEKLSI